MPRMQLAPHGTASFPPCSTALQLQDFLNRCNLPMEEMARSVPPTVCMLCLHGTADTTIPYAVRTLLRRGAWLLVRRLMQWLHAMGVAIRLGDHPTGHQFSPTPKPTAPHPLQDSELCASLVPNSRLILVEGADHNFTGEAAGQAMARHVVNFVLS